MSLEEIIETYENLRKSYRREFEKIDIPREALLEYQGRFTDLKASLRPIYAEVVKSYSHYDDKACTAVKYQLCISIAEGRLRHPDGSLKYPTCSINQAEKYAAGSDEYLAYIKKRSFWKESMINVTGLREDINGYLIEISNRLK